LVVSSKSRDLLLHRKKLFLTEDIASKQKSLLAQGQYGKAAALLLKHPYLLIFRLLRLRSIENSFVGHEPGLIILKTAVIGRHLRLYRGVTLGAKRFAADDASAFLQRNSLCQSYKPLISRVTHSDGCCARRLPRLFFFQWRYRDCQVSVTLRAGRQTGLRTAKRRHSFGSGNGRRVSLARKHDRARAQGEELFREGIWRRKKGVSSPAVGQCHCRQFQLRAFFARGGRFNIWSDLSKCRMYRRRQCLYRRERRGLASDRVAIRQCEDYPPRGKRGPKPGGAGGVRGIVWVLRYLSRRRRSSASHCVEAHIFVHLSLRIHAGKAKP